jgi:hypothetical protein
MPTIVWREPVTCPVCQLQLTVVHTDEGATVEYDVTEWTRLCRRPDGGSPLVCPSLRALVGPWLARP